MTFDDEVTVGSPSPVPASADTGGAPVGSAELDALALVGGAGDELAIGAVGALVVAVVVVVVS